MQDRRAAHARKPTFKAGKIMLSVGGTLPTVIRNISDNGAMLEVSSISGIPDEFTMAIEGNT